jgi:hypothetical protein
LTEDTHRRQGRDFDEAVPEMWKKYFRLDESNSLFEAWGVFVSYQLAASHVCMPVCGGVNIEITFSSKDLVRFHPVDALHRVIKQRVLEA